ncbi:protein-glutamine gamma-glutamyltransferase [Aneurinibacillus tyrosinisolvens]|uniref:protein-glutamine gamma-glutamyltransferase n=1 Tax=Aneurinibacillus tyrosinisolvens TaxID=1443435 RepID=UPI00063EDF74|nr:protein-glutamine gamma-glutamyltransferase [Aneurinibacillus tyrosinisolvens]
MIKVLESPVEPAFIIQQWSANNVQKEAIERMAVSEHVYQYSSFEQLRFELRLRSRMVRAARQLNRSGAEFATFKNSRCNLAFWDLTENGGFSLREGIQPAEGIADIFENGPKYAFECATAVMIVCYKAVLEVITQQDFNRLFSNLLLWDWHYDKDLGLTWRKEADYLPGDVQYFENPDVNPASIEWQGENVVVMENEHYYGHGIGIKTKQGMITVLNKKRKPGATVPAYLIDKACRPDFIYLSQYSNRFSDLPSAQEHPENRFIISQIGSITSIQM